MPSDFLEKSIEDIIIENKDVIHQKGLPRFKSKTFRQFYLPSGKKIDIISFDLNFGNINVDLYELKKDIVDTACICQAYNYLHEFMSVTKGGFNACDVRVIVVGRKYEPISLLAGLGFNLEIYTYDYGVNGIEFTQQDTTPKYVIDNDVFITAMWAWGLSMLHYPDGIPASLNIYSSYLNFIRENPDFDAQVREKRQQEKKEQLLLPYQNQIDYSITPSSHDPYERIQYVPFYDDTDETIYETTE